jgi:hypothetical protein
MRTLLVKRPVAVKTVRIAHPTKTVPNICAHLEPKLPEDARQCWGFRRNINGKVDATTSTRLITATRPLHLLRPHWLRTIMHDLLHNAATQ